MNDYDILQEEDRRQYASWDDVIQIVFYFYDPYITFATK